MTATIIVADASPLIALAKLDRLELLNSLFSTLYLPVTVHFEVTSDQARPDARLLKLFLDEHSVPHMDMENSFTQEISRILDAGEIQALALAKELNCGVLMDELRGRKVAQRYEIKTVGILGLLMQSKRQGLVNEVAPLIEELQAQNYRLSANLIKSVLEHVGE